MSIDALLIVVQNSIIVLGLVHVLSKGFIGGASALHFWARIGNLVRATASGADLVCGPVAAQAGKFVPVKVGSPADTEVLIERAGLKLLTGRWVDGDGHEWLH